MVSHKFGDDIFDVNGEIDRRRSLRKAGQYPDGLKWLANLVSPLIAQERVRLMDTSTPEPLW